MENTNNSTFSYDYSADKVKQAEAIMAKYVPQEISPLEKMKNIDEQVNRSATLPAITIGVIGALVLGIGMTLVMEASINFLGIGILTGMLGIGICGYAFLYYKNKLQKERAKFADEIVKLRQEI